MPLLVLTLILAGGVARAADHHAQSPVRVPLELRRGSAVVQARVNGSEPLPFKLDTGFGVTTLHPELAQSLGLKRGGELTLNGIAGSARANWYSGVTFDFAGAWYAPRKVVVMSSEAGRPRRFRSGILGYGFFRRFVVELDPREKILTLQEPEGFRYRGSGTVLPLEFPGDTPVLSASYQFPDQAPVTARFEVDTGCDGALCLGHEFAKEHNLEALSAARSNGWRSGIGGRVDTSAGRLPRFRLGAQTLTNLSANIFAEGSPARPGLAGHIGLDALRQFKVIFDYSRRQMILEPLATP